jgi:hypothetical protein
LAVAGLAVAGFDAADFEAAGFTAAGLAAVGSAAPDLAANGAELADVAAGRFAGAASAFGFAPALRTAGLRPEGAADVPEDAVEDGGSARLS